MLSKATVTACIFFCFVSILTGIPVAAQTVLSPLGSQWKYLDNGTNQHTAWRAVLFNDAAWKTGVGEFGYGDGDEATVVSYGRNASKKYVTTYFRRQVNITGKSNYTSFLLEFKRDDGIVIYVNGTEVKRDNMPSGTISFSTLASAAAPDDGATLQSAAVSASYFVEGNNVIAAEVHQNIKNTPDCSFDLRLTGTIAPPPAVITRGPYLQMGNQTAVTIRWRTDITCDTKVRYGTTAGNLTSSVSDAIQTSEHEIRVTGLTPDTKYYYSVGTTAGVIEESVQNFFLTAPPVNTARKIRITAYGDCGNNSANQVNVKNAYRTYVGSNATDLWLLLGDNAYNAGLDAEYQSNFFNVYKADLLKNIMLFPAPGNHDYANNATRQDDHNIPYLANFTLPKNGECGGLASGKEEYYSFDYGDIHFICLDSYGEENNKRFYDTTSTQILWLKNDLAANQRKWTIVFWHHPPYTMGSHNSDTESDLAAVRMNLNRILERFGVDLVLNGHSHDYERSYLINDHFGLENTFSFATNAVSNSSAKYDGASNSCPYTTTSAKIKHGTVYVVAGSAGQIGGTQGSFPHAAMYYSNATTGGSLALEIEGNRLDAKFIAADNTIKDQFTIVKDVNKTTSVSFAEGQSADLTASWIGNYNWSTGAITRSITVSPPQGNYDYFVNDNANVSSRCLADTFHVTVLPAGGFANSDNSGLSLKVYPNPAYGSNVHTSITSKSKQQVTYLIKNISGRAISSQRFMINEGVTDRSVRLNTGVYFIEVINDRGEHCTQKVIVK